MYMLTYFAQWYHSYARLHFPRCLYSSSSADSNTLFHIPPVMFLQTPQIVSFILTQTQTVGQGGHQSSWSVRVSSQKKQNYRVELVIWIDLQDAWWNKQACHITAVGLWGWHSAPERLSSPPLCLTNHKPLLTNTAGTSQICCLKWARRDRSTFMRKA